MRGSCLQGWKGEDQDWLDQGAAESFGSLPWSLQGLKRRVSPFARGLPKSDNSGSPDQVQERQDRDQEELCSRRVLH